MVEGRGGAQSSGNGIGERFEELAREMGLAGLSSISTDVGEAASGSQRTAVLRVAGKGCVTG